MGRTIDLDAAIDALKAEVRLIDGYCCVDDRVIDESDAIEAINSIPSAQTEQRWIPCKVQNPKETGLYTVTLYIEELNDRMLDLAWYDEEKRGWARYEEKGWAKDRPVIAWMSAPEPYREEKDGN